MYGDNIEYNDKQEIDSNIYFETILSSIKGNSFISAWWLFFNKLELSDHQYQTNGNIRDENYKGKLLFTMKDFV